MIVFGFGIPLPFFPPFVHLVIEFAPFPGAIRVALGPVPGPSIFFD